MGIVGIAEDEAVGEGLALGEVGGLGAYKGVAKGEGSGEGNVFNSSLNWEF